MPKPTLWQSILGKPSQAYSFPQENTYFSSKQDMLRIAAEVEQQRLRQQIQSIEALQQATSTLPSRTGVRNPVPPVTKIDPLSGRKRGNHDNHHHREERNNYESNEDGFQTGTDYRRNVMIDDEDDDGNMSDTSEDDVFYTPNTSPRMSVASTRSGGSSARLSRRSQGTSRKSSRRSLKMAAMSRQLSAGSATNSEASMSKTGTTPLRPPVRSKTEIDSVPDKSQIHGTIIAGQHQSQGSFGRGHTSASSLSSTSPDVYSFFSQPMSNSTRTSPPPRSDPSRDRESDVGRSGRARSGHEILADLDEEWTQDDGWPNDQAVSGSSSSKRKPVPPIPNGHAHSRKSNKLLKAMSKANPSIMMNMTALLEEDEDVITSSNLSPRAAYAKGSHPQSNVLVVQQESSRASSKPTLSSMYPSADDSFRSTLHHTSVTSTPDTSLASSKSRDTAMNSPKYNSNRNSNLRHRPSRSHEDLRSSARSGGHSRSVSITELASLPMPSGDLPSQGTPGFTSLVLPRAPPPSALTARSQRPKIEPSTDGRIDLTRSGIAQTTMATVEVVHGLGATAKGKGLLGALGRKMSLNRRKTVPVRTSLDRPRARRSEDNTAATGARELSDHQPLGFTSYRKPPDYVPSSCVLVQVWAVGVDSVDARLVGLRVGGRSSNDLLRQANTMNGHVKKGGSLRWNFVRSTVVPADQELPQPLVGYIPGRSFTGRVLECGWGVEDDIVKKGDWVVGLLDVRKAGALSEFIVVDKRRVHRVPHPKISGMSLKALGKQPERNFSTSSSSRTPAWGLTLEELALLPLCGVPAYRAVRTFVYAFSTSPAKDSNRMVSESQRMMSAYDTPEVDDKTGRRRRALVLRGHDGVGALAVRLLIAKGWDVSIHAPCPYPAESEEGDVYMAAVEERARAWGCDEIIFDDGIEAGGDEGRGAVVRVLERLWRDGDVIDAVLDTVGGKEIWEAAERVLKSSISSADEGFRTKKGPKGYAQFTTLVGDAPSRVVPSASDLFKAGVRSLRMGVKPSGGYKDDGPNSPGRTSGGSAGDRKVGYAWVGTAQDVDWEGQNISESIATVLKLALEGLAKPWVGSPSEDRRVVPFERAPEVFVDGGPLSQGSTVVVKIVE